MLVKHQKTDFGDYLVREIKAAGMSQESFYQAVGIKKPYFYDIIKNTPPSFEIQKRMIQVLEDKTGIDLERRNRFFDLAAQVRGEIPADISTLLMTVPADWGKVRSALSELLATPTVGNDAEGEGKLYG